MRCRSVLAGCYEVRLLPARVCSTALVMPEHHLAGLTNEPPTGQVPDGAPARPAVGRRIPCGRIGRAGLLQSSHGRKALVVACSCGWLGFFLLMSSL